MVKNALQRMGKFRALVLGDFLLDTYTIGKVKRISPEAPVPILEALREESRAGGAGNVVLNLAALGGEVYVAGRVGVDPEGKRLRRILQKAGARVQAFFSEQGYKTPVKNRLIAESQQLLRVDFETISPVSSSIEEAAIAYLEAATASVQVVALSDYGKGFLSQRLIASAIEIARRHNVPCLIDPKGIDFSKYKKATLLKPNEKEAYAAANVPPETPLEEVASALFSLTDVEQLLITRSEAGMSLFKRSGKRNDFPVRSREVKDVTGAGDTVLAALCSGLANGLSLDEAVQIANIAAGISVEKLGCAQIGLKEINERMSAAGDKKMLR